MKPKKLNTLLFLGICFLLLLNISCRKVRIIDSSAEIINREISTSLNDSALIYGAIYWAGGNNIPVPDTNVWIEETGESASADSVGGFRLGVLPGIYTIKCLGPYSDSMFTAVLDNVSLVANERIEVQFLHGSMSE